MSLNDIMDVNTRSGPLHGSMHSSMFGKVRPLCAGLIATPMQNRVFYRHSGLFCCCSMRKHIFLKSLLRQPALLTWLLGRRQRHRIELGLAPPKTALGTANGWVSASAVAYRQQQEWWQQAERVTSGGHALRSCISSGVIPECFKAGHLN